MRNLLLPALLAAATAAAAGRLDSGTDRPYDVGVVPPSSALRWTALGHPTTVANFWWLRAVQYIGDRHADQRGWDKLYPIVDLVTDLDPQHGYAYQVAGTILGSASRVAESNAILEKGVKNVPDRYILPFLRAFNSFYYASDYAEAGHWFEIAARAPGAPAHMRQSVLAMYVKGHRADAAIGFLEHSLAAAQDADTRKVVQEQLRRARLERAATLLDDASQAYFRRFAAFPADPEQLVLAGIIDAVPADPYGGVFIVGDDGRYRSSINPERFKQPEAPEQRRPEPGVGDEMKR